MTTEAHENHPGQPLLGLGLSEGLGANARPLPRGEVMASGTVGGLRVAGH